MAEMTPERSPLDGDEWQRVTQMHEVVKQEGDGRCEQAFDDLIRAHNVLLAALRAERERADTTERERDAFRATAAFTKRAWDEFADELRRITDYTGPDSGDVLLSHVKALTREVERLTKERDLTQRIPQVVDFLVQHHTLIRLRDTLRSLAEQADSAIHDAVEPSRLADIERDRDGLTREVERLRETLLEWQKRDGKLVYDDEDNGPTLCVCEWAADREAVLRAGHGHVCTLVRAALTPLESCQDRLERIRRAREEMRAPKDVDAAAIATNAVDAALTPPAPEEG